MIFLDGNTVHSFDDLVSYLVRSTKVGQTVTLSVLRNGKEEAVKVTLAARPKARVQASRMNRRTKKNLKD